MLAQFKSSYCRFIVFLLLFGAMILPVSAAPNRLNFSAYTFGTNISAVTLEGVRFIVPNTASVTVDSAASLDIVAGAGTDLIIQFATPKVAVRFFTEAYGSCQTGADRIFLVNNGEVVASKNFFAVPEGRCLETIFEQEVTFTEIHIDIYTDEAMYIENIVVDSADEPYTFQDGRINLADLGTPVVLYPVNYGDEAWGLHVYAADGSGLLWIVRPEAITADCPSSNTLIAEDSAKGLSLYRLAPNEDGICAFQLIAPTAVAGKVYVIIFDTMQPNTAYRSWEE